VQDQLNNSKPVPVPDVTSLVQPLAVAKIKAAGFVPKIERAYDDNVAKGEVVTEPNAGGKLPKGSTVVIVVSAGIQTLPVPDVRTEPVTTAIQQLVAAGFTPKTFYVYSPAQSDTVVAQSPAAKDIIKKGSTVRINVSKGLKPVGVPDVTGQPYRNAASALQGQGFVVSRVDIASDSPAGEVVSSDPPAGTSVPKGSKITLSVSKGPTTTQVPDVTEQSVSVAQQLLRGAGYSVALIYQPVTDPAQDGIVINEDPAGGTSAAQNAVITLTVGQLQSGTPGGDQGQTTTSAATTTTATTTTTP
jgi:beta-lactam-binding protein with PASTA domain